MSTSGVNDKGNTKVFCSFCERPSEEVAMVIASKFSNICSDCVSVCVKAIADKANQSTAAKSEIVNLGREISQGTITVRFENAPEGCNASRHRP
ncbi:ClpX C4-type zinc finger protein [Yersinia mollaretii]|uniref:ClpX C4-type zinc finger protein n=1 Tax=Yersinia mollaretii TaxID=33060 RepID=UPI00119F303D|nr:ClpX C4-type zinc finger protein [Yersinia mollaretii]